MPEPKRPLKVFLCHAHADRDPVRTLYARLTQDGVDAWLDKAKLLPGQDWELEIRKAVREADVVVVCLSKQFNEDGFRQREVKWALDTAMNKKEGSIFIIPARLEECDTLESLRKWHWVDLFEDDGYEKLVSALRARADKIGTTLEKEKISRENAPFKWVNAQRDRVFNVENPLRPLGYILALVFFVFYLLASAISVTNTIATAGVISPFLPLVLQRWELAVLGGSLLSFVVGVWMLGEMYGVGKLINVDQLSKIQKRVYRVSSGIMTLFAATILITLAVQRQIFLGSLQTNSTIDLIISFIVFSLVAINNFLGAVLTFQLGIVQWGNIISNR